MKRGRRDLEDEIVCDEGGAGVEAEEKRPNGYTEFVCPTHTTVFTAPSQLQVLGCSEQEAARIYEGAGDSSKPEEGAAKTACPAVSSLRVP